MNAPVVVILAAGRGTRMRSELPKLLHPLCGRPMIAWAVAAARAAGAARIVVVDGPDRALQPLLGADVELAVQQEARGTADAVRAAAGSIEAGETVIVLNGDAPLMTGETIAAVARAHGERGPAATLLTAVLADPAGYGRVVRAPDGTIERVVETKAPGDATEHELRIREVNAGLYAFRGGELLAALEEVSAHNAQGEHYLPDVLPVLRARERSVLGYELEDPAEILGVNDRVDLATVRAVAQRRIHERHMRAGVTVIDPAATLIDADVEIGQDTEVAPFCCLHGATRIADQARIGPHATLIDATVDERASILHSYVKEAHIGEGVRVGPFAYLRPGAVLRSGAKAGTFVEIKNSDIGPGSKVPHLSYIGDAEIGEGTNIGAGTITANYDGTHKHRTRIGNRAFVGVDTMLVAPVSIGDEAYTGGGSVITKDVPPRALGIARERQRNIEGYAERRAEQARGEKEQSGHPSPDTGDRQPPGVHSRLP